MLILAFALSAVPGVFAQKVIRVSIDIKPGDQPTTIEPGRQGMIPVAILTTDQFDAKTVDPATIRIGPTGTEASVFRSNLDDVDRDKDIDMLLLFRVPEMQVKCGDTSISLKGKTTDGRQIEGSESVTTEGCR
jgi:hypothetical protein